MDCDVLIIGGGPAGMTAAIYAARAGKKVMLFEGNRPGGTLNRLSRVANFPGSISERGEDIAERMLEQTLSFDVNIVRAFALKVVKTQNGFSLTTGDKIFTGKYVIYCGGVVRKEGNEKKFLGSGVSYCAVCDGNFYANKTVAVIGDGEKAVEDVKYLLGLCKKVYFVHTGGSFVEGAEDVVGSVSEYLGENVLSGIRVGQREILVDGAFIVGGGKTESLIKGLALEDGYIVTDGVKTNIEGFFAAGDCIKGSMRQIVSACYEGALAASLCK